MSVAGSCFLQWTQKILTINKKLSRYIPLLICFKRFFSITKYDYKVYVTKLLLCGNLSTFLRCVSPSSSRASTVRNVATYFAYSLVRTHFTTHEAFCNENRLNFRKYYLVFSRPSARRVGHKEAAEVKKEEGTIRIYIVFRVTRRAFLADPLFIHCCCHVLHATLRLSALRKADLFHTIGCFCDLQWFSLINV